MASRLPAAVLAAIAGLTLLLSVPALAQEPKPDPVPVVPLQRVVLQDSRVFTSEDVAWLLHLRTGSRLPAPPAEIARRLKGLYEQEGFAAASVRASFEEATGTLTVTVDEGRFEGFAFRGATPELERRVREELDRAGIREGEPFNAAATRRAVRRVLGLTNGGFRLKDIDLVEREGKRVVLIPVEKREREIKLSAGTGGREDLFSPVDGFTPGATLEGIVYDPSGFNYTLVSGFLSWKFGRETAGYSLGVERPLLTNTRLFIGTEIHDVTASDDRWRVAHAEQTLAGVFVKRTFRDYYRRRGVQVHAGFRPSTHQEVLAAWRRDRHEPLSNTTDFSLFRRDAEFRENAGVADAEVGALVLAYAFDSRGLNRETISDRYQRHLLDDLYRNVPRGGRGWRADWTSEIAGHGFGGDCEFTRHILNVRGGMPAGPHQSVAARALLGWSDGSLPVEREFAIGGIGTIHGHRFKAAAGEGMTLFNVEYALDVEGQYIENPNALRVLLFFDAGRIRQPLRGSDEWLTGLGAGVQLGPVRFEWGFNPDEGVKSGQWLVRLARGF